MVVVWFMFFPPVRNPQIWDVQVSYSVQFRATLWPAFRLASSVIFFGEGLRVTSSGAGRGAVEGGVGRDLAVPYSSVC